MCSAIRTKASHLRLRLRARRRGDLERERERDELCRVSGGEMNTEDVSRHPVSASTELRRHSLWLELRAAPWRRRPLVAGGEGTPPCPPLQRHLAIGSHGPFLPAPSVAGGESPLYSAPSSLARTYYPAWPARALVLYAARTRLREEDTPAGALLPGNNKSRAGYSLHYILARTTKHQYSHPCAAWHRLL